MKLEPLSLPVHHSTFPLCGGMIEIVAYDIDQLLVSEISEDVQREALRLQKIFNVYDARSELSRLNASRTMNISSELLFVLKLALEYCQKTNGAYDISHGRAFCARKEKKVLPSLSCTYRNIQIHGSKVCLTHSDVLIDLGSIAKGFIVDALVSYLNQFGVLSGYIDARGDLRSFGVHPEIVQVQHPRSEGSASPPFVLENSASATSGDYHQYDSSYERSHILGKMHVISATVVAPTAVLADVLATCAMITPPTLFSLLLLEHPLCKAFLIDDTLRTTEFGGFESLYFQETGVLNAD